MNIKKLRNDFPLLSEENQKNRKSKKNMPIYFDNACMSLKPIQVVEAMNQYYTEFPGCAGRSAHSISTKVNDEVYNARNTIKKFINAKRTEEIIFTRNTTEAINLVANSINFKKGDVVIQTDKEHNSNLVPWLIKQKNIGIKREFINSNSDNTFNLDEFEEKLAKLNNKVKLVAMGHTSNLDGTTIPADKIIKIAHKQGALVLLD
ncbi:aminotransferase class V-fold PLP-dependent enzyme, partial [Candidatus Woesearchaeota archaeon]|nr:aminotransferase class V-fold PLP-dependent enzyme [Candidatus Woesearchaeota archaeon]